VLRILALRPPWTPYCFIYVYSSDMSDMYNNESYFELSNHACIFSVVQQSNDTLQIATVQNARVLPNISLFRFVLDRVIID